jgi:hypothetical protein
MRHEFLVVVLDCTEEQAEKVMAERLGCDEDYGFTYRVTYATFAYRSVSAQEAEIERLRAEVKRLEKLAYLRIPIPRWLRR